MLAAPGLDLMSLHVVAAGANELPLPCGPRSSTSSGQPPRNVTDRQPDLQTAEGSRALALAIQFHDKSYRLPRMKVTTLGAWK